MAYSIAEISSRIYQRMGGPIHFFEWNFKKTLKEELTEKNLGKDLAQYRRIFNETAREVQRLVNRASDKKAFQRTALITQEARRKDHGPSRRQQSPIPFLEFFGD